MCQIQRPHVLYVSPSKKHIYAYGLLPPNSNNTHNQKTRPAYPIAYLDLKDHMYFTKYLFYFILEMSIN